MTPNVMASEALARSSPAQDSLLTSLPLSEQEQRLVQTIRLLEEILPGALDRVEQHIWELVGKNLKWSWNDPESLTRATRFMGLDPQILRKSKAISEEFAIADGDGLESY